jgi:hypothetical protein
MIEVTNMIIEELIAAHVRVEAKNILEKDREDSNDQDLQEDHPKKTIDQDLLPGRGHLQEEGGQGLEKGAIEESHRDQENQEKKTVDILREDPVTIIENTVKTIKDLKIGILKMTTPLKT